MTKKDGGNRITRELIRKRAEHNESIIFSLEELSLHQEEISRIDPVLGQSCRKLKILYLQNNIISKIENLHHMKDLEYLNLALNNIEKIEGLASCEFLHKLDLTVNFINLDQLEASIHHLKDREHLRELYMMGNPAQNDWEGFQNYVIHHLPQLERLDGLEISVTMRLIAKKQSGFLCLELRQLAEKIRLQKANQPKLDPDAIDTNASTPYTPEVRTAIYKEMAEQKEEEHQRKSAMEPKKRDFAQEQADAIAQARSKESKEETKIMQCNQGNWSFRFDEDSKPHFILLEVHIQRHLDSSLIDLDIHPTYLSVVIKSKTLRLKLPCEINASDSYAQRSKASGHLLIHMPKVDATPVFTKKYPYSKSAAPKSSTPPSLSAHSSTRPIAAKENNKPTTRVIRKKAAPSLASMLLNDADKLDQQEKAAEDSQAPGATMTALRTTNFSKQEDEPPPPPL